MGVVEGIITVIYYALLAAAAVTAYSGYRRAKKLEKDNRGTLYQIRRSDMPRRIIYGRTRLGPLEIYVRTSGSNNDLLHFIFVWGEGPCEDIEAIYFNDRLVTYSNPIHGGTGEGTGIWAGVLRIEHCLNGPDAAFPPNGDGVPFATAAGGGWSDGMPGWDSTDKCLGMCATWMRLKFDEDKFPEGIPNIWAVIKGRNDIYDERTEETGYTNNVALCWRHWLQMRAELAPALADDEIDLVAHVAAANVCDEDVELSTSGSEKRYTFNGVITADEEAEDIMDRFRVACAGTRIYANGKYVMHAGAWVEPTFEITPDMIVGPVETITRGSKRNRLNTIKGVYRTQASKWQTLSYPDYSIGQFVEDDKEVLPSEMDFEDTDSRTMCRRLAKIFLMETRYQREVRAAFNIECLRAIPGRPVMFTLPKAKFEQVPMMVQDFSFGVKDGKVEIHLVLRETNELIYAWSSAEDNANLAEPVDVPPLDPLPDGVITGGSTYGEILDGANPESVGESTYADDPLSVSLVGNELYEETLS